ncbi:MAG: hypothetical protein R3C19_03765 [Planctomycetaceae bacterium]
MTDVEILFLVLAVIYLSECVLWLPSRCQVLTGVPRRMRPAGAPDVLGNDRSRLHLLSLVPTSTTLVCHPPNSLLSDAGLFVELPDGTWHHIPFDSTDARSVCRDGRRLALGRHTVEAGGNRAAEQRARLVRRLSESTAPRQLVDAHLQRYTDINRASRRIHVLRERLSILQQLQLMLLVWIFGAGLILYYFARDGWGALWRYLIVTFLIWLATVIAAWRCSRRMYPNKSSNRWKDLLFSCVSPLYAVRASDRLSLDALGDEHPLAVAAAVMPRDRLTSLARRCLAELRHPVNSERAAANESPAVRDSLVQARDMLADALAESLHSVGIDTEALARPDDQDADAVCWCPRCFNQYTVAVEECPVCPGVGSVSFSAAS